MAGRKQQFRSQQQGIIILGEGITEHYYFSHLKDIFNFKCTVKPRLCDNTCSNDFDEKIQQFVKSDITIICVFDADVSLRNEKERDRIQKLFKKYKNNENVIFCDSLPSIEYWFLLHYSDSSPNFVNTQALEKSLKSYIPIYEKNKRFLQNQKWVREMSHNSGLDNAIKRSKKYSTGSASYSNIYKAIEKLKTSI
jgi:hypothetical protein